MMGSGSPYLVDSTAYLKRAREQLNNGTKASLVYAALEIRCGVEARLKEYLDPHDHISNRRKKDYKLKNLHTAAVEVSPEEEMLTRISFLDPTGEVWSELYYTPVSQNLKSLAERCGDLLHVKYVNRTEEWWSNTREWLEIAWEELRRANLGDLYGTPLVQQHDGRKLMNMNIRLPADVEIDLESMKDAYAKIRVEYLSEYPDRLLARRLW